MEATQQLAKFQKICDERMGQRFIELSAYEDSIIGNKKKPSKCMLPEPIQINQKKKISKTSGPLGSLLPWA
jgi:hypothetical protein